MESNLNTVRSFCLSAVNMYDDVLKFGYSGLTYLLTYLLTYSMAQDIILKADSHSACQKISCFLCGARSFIAVFTKARHWTLS